MPVCAECGTDNPDIARFCLACGQPLLEAAPEVRKVVTIVFSDLKGSTNLGESLDSEALREVMSRYFEAMQAQIERHGGTIEKFIGDAVMAVFGLPRLHEDDALRAVRAAHGMQRALQELNEELERRWGVRLANRTGVNTGEVVAGDPSTGQRLVTGDAVNVAARLEQAAGEQEVLLGELTYRLVRDAVAVEPVDPLSLKGKSEPVPAYRLVSLREDEVGLGGREAPLVGRDDELRTLTDAFGTATAARECRIVLLAGEAGVGKSRLTEELAHSVEDEAVVLVGRCLPYGDGVTFWPMVETVRSAAGIRSVGSVESARARLDELVGAEAEDVAERVASAIGLSARPFPVEELFWGVRRLFELLSRRRPLVVVFEDLHWAEATFLDLVEHLVAESEDAPILIVGTTRPELLERREGWPEHERATRIVLELLTESESRQVVENLLGRGELDPAVSALVIEASDGNPLFVEQMTSMLIDDGLLQFEDGRWRSSAGGSAVAVPPSIQALLAARLDSLEQDERAVLEPASVVGYVFPDAAVRDLVPETLAPAVDAELDELTRKQFVRPEQALVQNGHRFQHMLVRDTAYDGMLKRARASLHEGFVGWADRVNPERTLEYEEILGYHLEQAFGYLSELGPLDDHGRELGADGARRLASAGRRAFSRGDAPAAASLLGRAVALLPVDDVERLELLPDYGEALLQVGRFQEAEAVLGEAIEQAESVGAERVKASASLVQLLVKLRAGDPENWRKEVSLETVEAIAVFERAGDHSGLARAWHLLGWSHGMACRFGNAAAASERALEHARLADDVRRQSRASTAYAAASVFGPTPVDEAIKRCEDMAEQVSGDRQSEGLVLALLASLVAMQGSFDRARELYARGRGMLEDLHLEVEVANVTIEGWRIEMLAGDVPAAERELRHGYDLLASVGEKYVLSTVAGLLGQTLYVLGQFDEIEDLGRLARELATEDDVDTQALWRCVLGKVLARRGAFDEAETLVREALSILDDTDAVLLQFGALLDLAEVQRLAGSEELLSSLAQARRLAELKGSPVMAGDVDRQLAAAA